jgi:hypothetical protein
MKKGESERKQARWNKGVTPSKAKSLPKKVIKIKPMFDVGFGNYV